MRHVDYRRYPPRSSAAEECSAALPEFLEEIPNLFYFGYMPSRRVINEFLASGEADAGMDGRLEWAAFDLSLEEHAELVAAIRLAARPAVAKFEEVPDHVRSQNQWFAWVMEREMGIPFEEHLRLVDQESEALRLSKEAAVGGGLRAVAMHLRWVRVASGLRRFFGSYLKQYRKRRP